MNKCKYPLLFKPLKIGNLVAKNRLIAAPMSGGASMDGVISDNGVRLYEELAKSGVGIVIMGETMVHNATGNNHGAVMRLDHPGVVPKMRDAVRGVHRYGALASIELLHPGRRADPKFTPGGKVYAPTGGMAHYGDGEHYCEELDQEMIDVIVNAFGDAAEMGMICGLDMVTVQGAHGWLLSQFLSPNTNKRTDKYGGSIENRSRILIEVAQNIRKKCGPDFPIDFRLSGSDFMENGTSPEDILECAKLLAPYVDMLHISAASFDNKKASARMFPVMYLERGCNSPMAVEIKKHVDVPVITVGAFADPEQMEQMLEADMVDGFAIARGLIADPMLPEKIRCGREDDVIYCTRCMECLSMGFVPYVKYPLGEGQCAVNPWAEMGDFSFRRKVVRGDHKVLVVGAGPAGMEAALGAATAGHQVVLAEKTDSFGGMLKAAWQAPFKKDIKRFVDVLGRRIERNPNIKVEFNTTVTPEYIEAMQPDDVIVAIGAEPVIPAIPGIDNEKVIMATDIHEKGLGQKVVFIGGGMVGCEEGIAAAMEGKEVTILEMSEKIGRNAAYIHWLGTTLEMEKYDNLTVKTSTKVTAITEKGVMVTNPDGSTEELAADSVVLSVGMKPRQDEAVALMGTLGNASIVGDARKVARMNEAVTDGYFAGLNLQRLDPDFDMM